MERARDAGRPFPLVLLDAMMPEVDGFHLAEQIRGRPGLAGATLMMLSSAGRPGEAAQCRELGLAACLTKPIKQSELLDTIMTTMDGAALDGEAPPVPGGVPLPPPPRPLRLLLAEDNAVNQRLAVRLLEKRGHAVTVVGNGRLAVDLLEETRRGGGRFDAVLMDVQMPEMDGFEATAAIREREEREGGHVPIVAMTAHAMKGDRERCLAAGMDGYVSKPLQPQDLFDLLDALVPDPEPSIKGSRRGNMGEATTGRAYSTGRRRWRGWRMTRSCSWNWPDCSWRRRRACWPRCARRWPPGTSPRLERAAHSLKGSASNIDAPETTAAASRPGNAGPRRGHRPGRACRRPAWRPPSSASRTELGRLMEGGQVENSDR